MKRTTAIILASIILMFAFSGCTSNQTGKTANDTITSDLYFTKQEIRRSPDWVTKLDAAKECEQLIVVAGVDKTTAYVTMHEKNNKTTKHLVGHAEEMDWNSILIDNNYTFTIDGQAVEARLSGAPRFTNVGDRVRIKYLPEKPRYAIIIK